MPLLTAAPKQNPETDSFSYIESLVESLACLGKLNHAMDNIAQRIPVEVFSLVESTVDEVDERCVYSSYVVSVDLTDYTETICQDWEQKAAGKLQQTFGRNPWRH